jgi:hypothetical protein
MDMVSDFKDTKEIVGVAVGDRVTVAVKRLRNYGIRSLKFSKMCRQLYGFLDRD